MLHDLVHVKAKYKQAEKQRNGPLSREPVTNGSLHNGPLRSKAKLLTQACAALLFF